jgi:antitoxin component YwqK of YwqJK toxin-antitoxin module
MYFGSGQLKQEMNYKNGKLDGISRLYYESGQLMQEMNYRNGRLEGPPGMYDENGAPADFRSIPQEE